MRLGQRIILFAVTLLILGLGEVYSQARLAPEEADKLIIERPEPVYPEFARMLKLQDTVKVEITVSEMGVVISSKLISGNPVFKTSALEAAKKCKYKPHEIGGKPVPFVTIIDFLFSLGVPKDEYERQQKISQKFFKEEEKCRNLVRSQKWKEAETICKATVELADQFSSDRELEKSGAYQLFGYVMMGLKQYQEALKYYNHALDAVRSKLTEKNAELGQLYGDMAIAHHVLRDLDKARELYRKAEGIYRLAHASIGGNDSNEEVERIKQEYMRSLKKLLEYHLIAAEDAGAVAEMEEIKKMIKSIP